MLGEIGTRLGPTVATLATATEAVHDGSLFGAALIAGAGGFGAAALLNTTLFPDDVFISQAERAYRARRRASTLLHATLHMVAGVAIICSTGPIRELSIAGVASGLYAIGQRLGGEMAAGVCCMVAFSAVNVGFLGLLFHQREGVGEVIESVGNDGLRLLRALRRLLGKGKK